VGLLDDVTAPPRQPGEAQSNTHVTATPRGKDRSPSLRHACGRSRVNEAHLPFIRTRASPHRDASWDRRRVSAAKSKRRPRMILRNWKLISKGGGRASVGLPIAPQTTPLMIETPDHRDAATNAPRASLNLSLTSSAIVSKECNRHEQDGNRWISLPLQRQIDLETQDGKDPTTGYPVYVPIIETRGKVERARFLRAALGAVDQLLRRGAP
jgi:hypothetical protein